MGLPAPAVAALGAAAAGAACFGYGLVEARRWVVREVRAPLLPPDSADVRVLHLSDIHLVPTQRAKLAWVASLAELRPDLVVNTGDNFCAADALEPLLDAFGGLLDVPGVFVWGSNDYYAPTFRNPVKYVIEGRSHHVKEPVKRDLPWRELGRRFAEHGWVDLNHHRADLTLNGSRFAFRGVDDAHLDRDDYSLVAGPADPSAALNVGVMHAPYLRVLDAMTADGVQLMFAGHTHGGQVCVPGYGALVTNCDLDAARVKGLSSHRAGGREAALHVSAGIGTSPYARYRFACRPEATLLTLTGRVS